MGRASRYSRYDPDRRSRSPRDRSPDRFDRGPPYDQDRRRSSAESRGNPGGFPSNREGFGDPMRRDPPRGPKALIDIPNGPMRGGFGDFRGGRGRGRGRPWPNRDDSRERGRDRDIDFRDRYRDDRSRERDRDRDRDWRDRDFGRRRSPIGRPRSPNRDFRDRDRDAPPPVDAERPRRNSRDGGPPSAGSSASDPPFGGPPFTRGGGFLRGRGRGGRGDWGPDRSRGRTPYDERSNDRYPRSRSQEGRWARERDERDNRGDRYPEDARRDVRDDRDRLDRDHLRGKPDVRTPNPAESAPQSREVSPPPVAPSAPAFGSVPSRGSISIDGAGKPPSMPRAHSDRPPSSGHLGDYHVSRQTGPASPSMSARPPPQGPRQFGRRIPDSPKAMRSQTFSYAHEYPEQRRPRSSGANSDFLASTDNRSRSNYSAEPGEIVKGESEAPDSKQAVPDLDEGELPPDEEERTVQRTEIRTVPIKDTRRRKRPGVSGVRFALPPKASKDDDSESDDDEDMADYFDLEISKTESELSKLQKPQLPLEVLSRFASLSHGSMVKILNDGEGLVDMLGDPPESIAMEAIHEAEQLPMPSQDTTDKIEPTSKPDELESSIVEAQEISEAAAKITEEPLPTVPKIPEPESKEEEKPALEVEPERLATAALAAPEGDRVVDEEEPRPGINGTSHDEASEPEQVTTVESTVPMEITETGSKVPTTPSQIEDDETESEDDAYMDVDAIRQYMTTPPPDTLPNYAMQAWDKDSDFLTSLDADPIIDNYVAQHMSKVHLDKDHEQNEQRHIYADNYIGYLDFTTSSDPVAVKSRDKFSVTVPVPEPVMDATPEPKPEGRTSGRRFASERDLERVLQASMREDEERKERELRIQKEKYRSEKEADIPTMYWNSEDRQTNQYWDHTGYVPQNRLVSAWQVLAPVNNFTKEESELFEKRYLEFPKQWGRIAEAIPNRDFGACIQYYYLMKKDLNLKEKLKKQPKRRKKGRGKQRSSALMSELGNADPETEDNQETGENGERRRPRRAAAPTWGFEQPPIDPDTSTPASTPGRRVRGEQGEKTDGRRRGRKSAKDKEKEAKEKKANQSLSAASTPGATKGRPRSSSRMPEGPVAMLPNDVHPAVPNFEQAIPSGIQPPFSVHSQPMSGIERQSTPVAPPPIPEVLTAPSLRPEPPQPPQPAMATFNLAQANQDRKGATQASSYWSVSESTDFPLLLAAFGSDWTAIANHMGSKTAVMVKNYFVRQKDQFKPELEEIVQEADAKRMRGEKRPEPPMPTTGGRGRRYDLLPSASGRPVPFGVPPGMEMHNEVPPAVKQDAGQPGRAPTYPAYSIPIAKAPAQSLGQPAGPPVGAQAGPPPVSQAMSPNSRMGRGPPPAFGFPDRGPLAPKVSGIGSPDLRDQRALHERQKADISLRDPHIRDRERERDLGRQPMRVKQEDMPPQHGGYEPFGHRQQSSLGGQIRPEPMSLGRPATTEPPRNYAQAQHHGRGLLGETGPGQSPPMARPLSTMGSRPPSGEHYPPHAPPPQSSTPGPVGGGLAKPSEPRKTSNIMSLLNDDPPPAPKRVNEVASRPVATPPPQSMSRPPPAQQPPPPMRREQEAQYHPYGRSAPPPATPSGMPSLKPTQPPPMSGSRMAMETQPERDYYRSHAYPAVSQNTATNSPPTVPHRYAAPPAQQGYQPQPGYPAQYGSAPPPHAASPPPTQYASHAPPRARDPGPPPPQNIRDPAWPAHQQPPSNNWQQAPAPKTSQGPPPPQSWSPAPQQSHPHVVRDERAYSSQSMQSRYAPPPSTSRPPDPGPPPPAGYNRYSSTPVPRDPREIPGRSYTPVAYDTRGPVPPQQQQQQQQQPPPGPGGYPAPDPRDAQLRDSRDPRDMIQRGLRPQEYDRRQDRYGR